MEPKQNNEYRVGRPYAFEAETVIAIADAENDEGQDGDEERKREHVAVTDCENHALLPQPTSSHGGDRAVAATNPDLGTLSQPKRGIWTRKTGEKDKASQGASPDESSISLVSLSDPLVMTDDQAQRDGVAGSPKSCVSQNEATSHPQFPVYRCEKVGCTCTCRPCILCQAVVSCRSHTGKCCSRFQRPIGIFIRFVLLAGVAVYLGFAFHHSFGDEPSLRLLGIALLALAWWLCGSLSRSKYFRRIKRPRRRFRSWLSQHKKAVTWITVAIVAVGMCYFLLVDVILRRPNALVSALGLLVYVIIFYGTSHNPAQVNWRTVGCGLVLQFGVSLLVLRTRVGSGVLRWVGDRMSEYLHYADSGAMFVFGESYDHHQFAFKVMPRIVYLSATISVLWYYGVVKRAVALTSRVVTFTLGTEPWESMHAALSVFMGWAETLMVVRPVLDVLTPSQLHTVMTNSFATVSGGTAAVFLQAGVPANHLLAAAFMSAPASLALSKLSYPDSPADKNKSRQRPYPALPQDTGFIEAIVSGAKSSVVVISYVIVNVIAFMSILHFLNDAAAWLTRRVGWELNENSIQTMGSTLFWPFAFLMGVPSHECSIVARLLGLKLILNNVAALQDLGAVHRNGEILQNYTAAFGDNGTIVWTSSGDVTLLVSNVTLRGGVLSSRSEAIATFAVCSFSDVIAYCVLLAALVSAAPSRKNLLVAISLRAWLCGIVSGFLSASMAGLILTE